MAAQKSSSPGTLGAEASARWLTALSLAPVPRWYAEITLADGASRFCLNIYAEEWGFAFHHEERASWIRVTDIAFVHGRDDYALLAETPDLMAITALISRLESTYSLSLVRGVAEIRTSLDNAEDIIRAWLARPAPRSSLRRTREL